MQNAAIGFQHSGIWPLDINVFDDSDFAPSSITDANDNAATVQAIDCKYYVIICKFFD